MTLPDERYRAVVQTEKFLREIVSTPRIPKKIKDDARWCLRHYPNEWELKRAAEKAPDVFAQKMEPVYRMIKQYEKDKEQ
jgi:hypothetical protein